MGEPTITFDGKQKQYLKLTAPYNILKRVLMSVTGINLSKDKRYIRCATDEMSCYYIMQASGLQPNAEVLAWLHELKDQREHLSHLIGSTDVGFPLVTGYEDWLHKFQTCDVKFMVESKRCINANDVGVGKTIEAIAATDEVAHKKQQVLIIAPKSLMYMWQDEFKARSFGEAIVCDEKSSYKRREKIQAKLAEQSRIKVISYSMLDAEKWPELFATPWDVIICDEAHKLKNPDTKTSKNFMKLESEYLWLLTGTPDPNGDLKEIYGMLRLIDPTRFTSMWGFLERYGDIYEESLYLGGREQKVKKLGGIKEDAKPVLHRLLVPYMFRRLIRDVHELPEEIHRVVKLELSAYERKMYDELLQEMMTRVSEENWLIAKNTLDRDIRLRLMLLNPALVGGKDESTKTDAIFDLLEGIPGQVVIFTCYKKYTQYLEGRFAKAGLSALRVDGDVDAATIRAREKAFQRGDAKIIYGTLAKMSEGFNLQNAQAMIRVDRSYVPKDNIQAKGRIIRPGQTNRPVIYDLQARNTIDEIIDEVNVNKQANITAIESFQYMVDKLREAYV